MPSIRVADLNLQSGNPLAYPGVAFGDTFLLGKMEKNTKISDDAGLQKLFDKPYVFMYI